MFFSTRSRRQSLLLVLIAGVDVLSQRRNIWKILLAFLVATSIFAVGYLAGGNR